jgi:hypothetical protein
MAASTHSTRPRRLFFLLASATLIFIIYYSRTVRESWRALPLEKIGLGDVKAPAGNTKDMEVNSAGHLNDGDSGDRTSMQGADNIESFLPVGGFQPGNLKAAEATYSKMLVIARTTQEDVGWISNAFNNGDSISTAIYVVDDPSTPFHPPENKGHEVMVYLTYIIDQYDNLSDISIFMHSHRYAWHNNELLSQDAVQIITRLSPARVQREGYVNLRCDWTPGCPSWMHPGAVEEDGNKKEEVEYAAVWAELFPGDPVPQIVAQPCCAQFALSRERIRQLPKSKYVRLREWLLRTPLRDSISGRVWEYVWHFIFTGQHILCPKEHVCYCDVYGICFGGEEAYDAWWGKMWERRHYADQLEEWHSKADAIAKAKKEGRIDEATALTVPEFGLDEELEGKIAALDVVLNAGKAEAMQRGDDPRNRAMEAGRQWKEGDGF